MKLFSFGKEREKLTLIFDIQSSVVRGALVGGISNNTPSILHSCIIHVPFRQGGGSSYLVKRTMKAVEEVFEDAMRYIHDKKHMYDSSLADVHFVLSSPWITSRARIVSIEKDHEVEVNQKLIQSIIDEERKGAPVQGSILSVIEEKVFDVRLNGYSIVNWDGKHARHIEVAYTSSYADLHVIEKFSSLCSSYVGKRHIHFHSSLLLQYIGIQGIYEHMQNYAIIYLHGELTDVVIVRHGFPIFFGSFPFGVHTLIRKVAKNTRTDVGTAESMLSLFIAQQVDEAHFSTAKTIIDEVTHGWREQLHKMIDEYLHQFGAGYDIIVSSRTHEDYFISCVRNMYQKARVQSLSSELVQHKVPFSSKVEHIRLLALYASALSTIHSTTSQ